MRDDLYFATGGCSILGALDDVNRFLTRYEFPDAIASHDDGRDILIDLGDTHLRFATDADSNAHIDCDIDKERTLWWRNDA